MPARAPIMNRGMIILGVLTGVLTGCAREARLLASDQPQTAPDGPGDPRESRYQDNYYQVSQGARYFSWYGCAGCHGPDAKGVLDLADGRWLHGGSVDQVYRAIGAHPAPLPRYGERIPIEQLWQLTAFARDLSKNDPGKNRRNALEQEGEPQGTTWRGPLR
jgi:mono/diheme cytochrome c family protein